MLIFAKSVHLPEAPRGWGGEADYIHIRRNCTLWFWQCKNFANSNCSSKTKQRERLMGCMIIYYPRWLRTIFSFIAKRVAYIYVHWRGAFGVARFDLSGNARAFLSWNEWQNWLHAFMCVYQPNAKLSCKGVSRHIIYYYGLTPNKGGFYKLPPKKI